MDLARDLFTVSYDESQTSTSNMFEAIQTLGYEPTLSVSEFSATPTISREQLPTEVLGLLDSNKPVSLYFGAKWCGACKIMERTTLANESVKKSLDRYRFLKVDIEEQEDISAGFSIRGVPTLLILNSSGDEVYRYIGPLTSSEISLVLDQFDES